MLHVLYLTANEYTRAGAPDFLRSNSSRGVDYQWTDLFAYLPNPTNEPLPDRFSGYSVLYLLPSYARRVAWRGASTYAKTLTATVVHGPIDLRSRLHGGGRYAVGALCERITVTLVESGAVVSRVRWRADPGLGGAGSRADARMHACPRLLGCDAGGIMASSRCGTSPWSWSTTRAPHTTTPSSS